LRAHDYAGGAIAALRRLRLDKARCSGLGFRSVPSPSTVVILQRCRATTGVRQEKIASPSTITVQAPHCPRHPPAFAAVELELAAQKIAAGPDAIHFDEAISDGYLQPERPQATLHQLDDATQRWRPAALNARLT
jgi:hypothetical protein